jgi:PIN domain nuclease of toxin-antitoxin system
MKTITPTEFRSNHYRLLDEVIDTGIPLEIKKGGKTLNWTHDPFDRIIVANAQTDENMLLTKDSIILSNYENGIW